MNNRSDKMLSMSFPHLDSTQSVKKKKTMIYNFRLDNNPFKLKIHNL